MIDTHFARAIRKHGADNFHTELIDTATSQEELTRKEQQWINYYRSQNPQYGYNETDAIYKSGGNTYQNKSAEEMSKISRKIRETKLGGSNPHSKKVKCLNVKTNQELVFDSFSLCKNHFNEPNHRFITTRVLHETRSLYKGEWAIAYYEDEYYDFKPIPLKRLGYIINIEDTNDNSYMTFNSITKASKFLGYDRHYIGRLLKQKQRFTLDHYNISVSN